MTPGSSLLLSWENPAEVWTTDVREVRLVRTIGQLNGVLIRDVPWGVYEDLECRDPAARYSATYHDSYGAVVANVRAVDIDVIVKPAELCKIDFLFVTVEGFPWKDRTIQVEAIARSEGSYRRRLVTNGSGFAQLFLLPGTLVRILPDGAPYAVEVAIPDVHSITWEALAKLGSKADVDPRFSIGVF